MRTTLTLDPDVAERLRQETASGKLSQKEVINERLRIGFGLKRKTQSKPYRVEPHSSPYRPGVDRAKLNQLVDELEVESFRSRTHPA